MAPKREGFLPIGLAAWIIQDGNYADFTVGEVRSFALEFHTPKPLKVVQPTLADLRYMHAGNGEFDVVAECFWADDEWSVLNFGLPAYSSNSPVLPDQVGALYEGRVQLSIDHFAYFKSLSQDLAAPALIFDWRIERIGIQTAPWVSETAPFLPQGKMLVRDPDKIDWRDVRSTNAWQDDNGSAEYLLHCRRLSDEPRRGFRVANAH